MDEHLQAVGRVPQDVVCTAAHNDTGALLRQVQDDMLLHGPEEVLGRGALEGVVGKRIGQPVAVGGLLPLFLNVLLGEPTFLGEPLNKLVVVAGDSQTLGGLPADGAASASEFPADGNDPIFHRAHPD